MVLALSFLLAASAPVSGSWLKLFEEAGEATFIDQAPGARARSGGMIWIRHDYPRARAGGIRSVRDQWHVDCGRRSFTMYALVSYDAKGRIVRAEAIPPEGRQAAPVIPGSRMARVFNAVCG